MYIILLDYPHAIYRSSGCTRHHDENEGHGRRAVPGIIGLSEFSGLLAYLRNTTQNLYIYFIDSSNNLFCCFSETRYIIHVFLSHLVVVYIE